MKNKYNFLASLFLVIGMTSCELFGLEYSESEEYIAKEQDNKVEMTALEFIRSRTDIFSSLLNAIQYAGIEDLYLEPGNTYVLLTNTALTDWDNENSYWSREKVEVQGNMVSAGAWSQYSKEKVAEMLKYHIIKGEWSFHNLSSETVWGETYGEGSFEYSKNGEVLQGDTAVMAITLGYDRNQPLHLNNYDWNYRGVLSASTSCCRTTNIHLTNGYAHVTDYYLERPTRNFLGLK